MIYGLKKRNVLVKVVLELVELTTCWLLLYIYIYSTILCSQADSLHLYETLDMVQAESKTRNLMIMPLALHTCWWHRQYCLMHCHYGLYSHTVLWIMYVSHYFSSSSMSLSWSSCILYFHYIISHVCLSFIQPFYLHEFSELTPCDSLYCNCIAGSALFGGGGGWLVSK